MFGTVNLVKLGVLAIVLCGLVSVRHLPRLQGQHEVAVVAQPGAALSGVVRSPKIPLQVAILHWYNANQTASFPVGTEPTGVAFDGGNIWVVNDSNSTVSKLRASDGTTLGTFAVGFFPLGVAFDGANIWVTDPANNNLSKLRDSDGTTLVTFSWGTLP